MAWAACSNTADMPAVRAIDRAAARSNNHFSSFVLGIVKSPPFQMRRAEDAAPAHSANLAAVEERTKCTFITKNTSPAAPSCAAWGQRLSLPLLDSMVPAQTPLAQDRRRRQTRFCCIEMVHGAAGSTGEGTDKHYWSPDKEGADFEFSQTLEPLAPYRDYITIVSNTDLHPATAWAAAEEGADHFRSSAVYLTAAHPKMTEGSDYYVGTSIDQIYAQQLGQDTPLPSIQLCIEMVDASGACDYGYACVYADTISWASPTTPLPMTLDPRMAFENLFGEGGTPEERADAPEGQQQHSRLDLARRHRACKKASAPATATASTPISTTCAKSSAASSASKSTMPAAKPARCPQRRSACPIPTKSTSS